MYEEIHEHLVNGLMASNRKLYEEMGSMDEWDEDRKRAWAVSEIDQLLHGVEF